MRLTLLILVWFLLIEGFALTHFAAAWVFEQGFGRHFRECVFQSIFYLFDAD